MDSILLIGLLILVFIGIPIGLGLLFYYILKKLGHPKTAKYLTISYSIIVLSIGLYIAFEDHFFTKNNAKELIEEQEFKLFDDFELVDNESMSGIGEFYHTFTLKISVRDKQNAINKIKSSDNFKKNIDSKILTLYKVLTHRYYGKKVILNYETEKSFVREYFEGSGHEGYSPTNRRITIYKKENKMTFEDIDE